MTAATMAASTLRAKAFGVWFTDLERWSVGSFTALDWRWPRTTIRPLAEALTRKSADVARRETDAAAIKLITLHFDGEIDPRRQRGTNPIKGRLWWADPGDVVYSQIDVRNGAIGIVPEDLGRVCVTSEYPVYTVNPAVTDAGYIKLLFRTTVFRRKINTMISGASGRKRVQPSDLEAVDVPLPPLSVQRTIVSEWGRVQSEVADLRRRIAELEDQIEADFLAGLGLTKPKRGKRPKVFGVRWKDLQPRWGVEVNQQAAELLDAASGKYPAVQLGDVIADLENGWSPKCHDRPANADEWGVLKMGAVSFGSFDASENKALLPKANPRPALEVKPGDWLISRANVTRLVGACALVRKARPHLMLCDKIFRAVWRDPSPVLPGYLDEIVKVPHLRHQIENNATGTSATMKNITKPALLGLRLPLPPLGVQSELVSEVSALRRRIADFKAEADVKARLANAEVEAMILGEKLCPG